MVSLFRIKTYEFYNTKQETCNKLNVIIFEFYSNNNVKLKTIK